MKKAEKAKIGTKTDFHNRVVWVRDAAVGYRPARVVDITHDGFRVKVLNSQECLKTRFDDTFACDADFEKSVEDNCALLHLNEATLLHNCRLRYQSGKIYTYIANILISINPYQPIPGFYSSQKIAEYRGKSIGQKEPHIFAIADKAYREMRQNRESQSIIVSGESGAGKTEAQKSILKFLCQNWGADVGPIQQRLLETNPILEAFGNARTRRNNNSSRFGKFVQIHFSDNQKICGGYVSHYLLETSRICRQVPEERNYHIFYQLIAGSDEKLFKSLSLAPPDRFRYLCHGSQQFFSASKIPESRTSDRTQLSDPLVDDVTDFRRLQYALTSTGISAESQISIFRTISAILHLGNVDFCDSEGTDGGSEISENSRIFLTTFCRLLSLELDQVRGALLFRTIKTEGTTVQVGLKPEEAAAGRDALAKAIYGRLFDQLVSQINASIPFGQNPNSKYIGVLDFAGFESFEHNHFEQFCINYSNEKLQQFFNQRILKNEQEMYKLEGLKVPKVEFDDNQDVIEIFEKKRVGIFDLLDEEQKLPRPDPGSFSKKVHMAHKWIEKLGKGRLDSDGFTVRHFAGKVGYLTEDFLVKNNDRLHNSLELILHQVFTPFTPMESQKVQKSKSTKTSTSISLKFRHQLAQLLAQLHTTATHFVRCIKPNDTQHPWHFSPATILAQLKFCGMPEVLKLMQNGYPNRTNFGDFYQKYQGLELPRKLTILAPRFFAKCIFHALGLDAKDFQFGTTKVFFGPGKFAEFDLLMRSDKKDLMEIIDKVARWIVRERWRRAIFAVWSTVKLKNKIQLRTHAATTIQSYTRGHQIRQRTRKALELFRKLAQLGKDLKKVKSAEKLEQDVGKLLRKLRKLENLENLEVSIQKRRKQLDSLISEQKEQEIRILKEKQEKLEKDEKERLKLLEIQKKEQERLKNLAEVAPSKSTISTQNGGKHDLSGWSIAQLRDAINTSNDINLLIACKDEFHTRLRCYNEWKTKNAPNVKK